MVKRNCNRCNLPFNFVLSGNRTKDGLRHKFLMKIICRLTLIKIYLNNLMVVLGKYIVDLFIYIYLLSVAIIWKMFIFETAFVCIWFKISIYNFISIDTIVIILKLFDLKK